jgi:hypothetical protein
MIQHAMREWMTTQSGVTDLLDNTSDISTEKRKEREKAPYITIALSREFPIFYSGAVSNYTQAQVEISCEHDTEVKAAALAEAVQAAFKSFARGTMGSTTSKFVNAITDIDITQRRETIIAGKDRYPAYNIRITLDYTDA